MSTETVAADRNELERVLCGVVDGAVAEVADYLLASGILLDAAAVRHEHGERIAAEAVDKIQRYMATRGRMGTEYDDGVDAGLSTAVVILLGCDTEDS